VLDEVDAPLDDAQCRALLQPDGRDGADTDTRFVIITHNAITMARMDRLFGVTMAEQGVSQLVSVDLKRPRNCARRASRPLHPLPCFAAVQKSARALQGQWVMH
jgi:chromosome segregation protein